MPKTDERPPIWIGHMSIAATDIEKSVGFMRKLGMRNILQKESVNGGAKLVQKAA